MPAACLGGRSLLWHRINRSPAGAKPYVRCSGATGGYAAAHSKFRWPAINAYSPASRSRIRPRRRRYLAHELAELFGVEVADGPEFQALLRPVPDVVALHGAR